MADPDAHFVDLLAHLGEVRWRRMFGGYGAFHDGLMVALLAADRLYLKVDAQSRPAFVSQGLQPFTYRRGGRDIALSYYEAPAEAMDDPQAMAPWADGAYAAALRSRR